MNRNSLLALGLTVVFAGCTSNNAAVEPKVTQVNPISQTTLQMSVGTATIPGVATGGLNVVATLRQNAGDTGPGGSGVLVDTPTITGPAGFVVPAVAQASGNAGTNVISGNLNALAGIPGVPTANTTFAYSGGLFGAGFAPANATAGGTANYPRISGTTVSNVYAEPLYAGSTTFYIGGPPAFPQARDGSYGTGFAGFPEGFTAFQATPVAGAYSLSVQIPTSSNTFGTQSTSATLTTATPVLGAMGTPTMALDGAGGGTVTLTIPAGVTETLVTVFDQTGACHGLTGGAFYTLFTTSTGTVSLALPSQLGPPIVSSTGIKATQSICTAAANNTATSGATTTGDKFTVYAVGFDYPQYEALYPQNTSTAPTIRGTSGQSDITFSPVSAVITSP